MKQVSIYDPGIPKFVRKKVKLIAYLAQTRQFEKLRRLRDTSKTFEINIYHHSEGTDSYFHDVEGKYYTWAELEKISEIKLADGRYFSTIVIPYPSGVYFKKGFVNPQHN